MGEATPILEQVLQLRQTLGDRYGEGQALYLLGKNSQQQGQCKQASKRYLASLHIFRQLAADPDISTVRPHAELLTQIDAGFAHGLTVTFPIVLAGFVTLG